MNIGEHNIDEWIFNSLEGNLNIAEQRHLQDFLIDNPTFLEDYGAWENTFINKTDVPYPAMDALLKGKMFYEAGWFKWGLGFLTGVVLSFGSMQMFEIYKDGQVADNNEIILAAQGNQNTLLQNSESRVNYKKGNWTVYQVNLNGEKKVSDGSIAPFVNYWGANSTSKNNLGSSWFQPEEAQDLRIAEAAQKTNQTLSRNSPFNPGLKSKKGALISSANYPHARGRDASWKLNGVMGFDSRPAYFEEDKEGTYSAELLAERGMGPVREPNTVVTSTAYNTYYTEEQANADESYRPDLYNYSMIASNTALGKKKSSSRRGSYVKNGSFLNIPTPRKKKDRFMEPVLYGTNTNPLYQNPAFAGSMRRARVMFNYRNQWVDNEEAQAQTYLVSYDNYFKGIKGGIGVQAKYDETGFGLIKLNELGFSYSPKLINIQGVSIEPAVRAGIYQRAVNSGNVGSNVILKDVRSRFQYGSDDDLANHVVQNLDFGAGLLIHSDKFYVSISSDHLLEPSEEVVKNWAFKRVRSYRADAGMKFQPLNGLYITPALHYYRPYSKSILALSTTVSAGPLFVGGALVDGSAYQLSAGIDLPVFRVSYRYDNGASPHYGILENDHSHEIGIRFFFDALRKKGPHIETYSGGLGKN